MSELYKPYIPRTTAHAIAPPPVTEFDILKSSHKFLRDDADSEAAAPSWNDKLAQKYYESLYREFAICDLKHYKSGNFALRWRTESEVLSGTGETTCANTRCPDHVASSAALTTLELPFAYDEHGHRKEALVKVVLCSKCVRKIMWKRKYEKRRRNDDGLEGKMEVDDTAEAQEDRRPPKSKSRSQDAERSDNSEQHSGRQRRRSRSRSPLPYKRKRDTSPTLPPIANTGPPIKEKSDASRYVR